MRIPALCVAVVAALLFAAPADADAPPVRGAATHPLWGSSTTADFDRELDKLVEAGANTVRIDLGWSTLEADGKGERSDWYVAKADTFFAHARARGLKVVVTLWTTPCWASKAPPDIKQDCAGAWWDRGVDRYPPADPADFADAAAWVASRWAADLAAIEIWNEANYQPFFRTTTPAADYAAMLKASYTAVKAASPSTAVIGPGMVMSDPPFLQALYDRGIKGYADAISSHPFARGNTPFAGAAETGEARYSFADGVPALRDVMVANGDGARKLWFTEFGWSSCAPAGTSSWCVTPEQQAQNIGDAFRIIRDRWNYVGAAFVYNLRNTGTDTGGRESQMGMLHRDFTAKPSFAAFAAAMDDMAANPLGPPPIAPPPPPSPAPPAPVVTSSGPPPSRPLSPADTVAPAVAALKASAVLLRRPRAGGRVSYRLSEEAEVRLALARVVRARCVLRSRRNCTRLARMRGSVVKAGRPGANALRLGVRWRGRALKPGRYALLVTARDAAGNVSREKSASFLVRR